MTNARSFSQMNYKKGYEDAKAEYESMLNKIRAEIEQVAEEEREHDKRWAQGLKYALTIIDKQKIKSEVNNG